VPAEPTTPTTPVSSGVCPICQTSFARTRRQSRRRYCSAACRRTAWRRRQPRPATQPAQLPAEPPMAIRACPHCDQPVTIVALLVTPQAARPAVPTPSPKGVIALHRR
jgi:hypothetical protein